MRAVLTSRRTLGSALVLMSLVAMGTLAQAGGRAFDSAHSARTLSVDEIGHLHLVKSRGVTLYEQGTATGTFNCSLAITFVLNSPSRATATFTAYPHGGSISGRSSARYSLSGATGRFEGTLTVTGGTGAYAHAKGRSLKIKGTVNRSSYKLNAQLSGTMHL